MISLAQKLMAGSAAVVFLLGAVHLLYTFRGNRLFPRRFTERRDGLMLPAAAVS